MGADASSLPPDPARVWRGVHRALGDPLRIRLFQSLWQGPRSAKELSDEVGLPPDRLYYHLRQLQQAGIVEVAGYRELPGGKTERVYRQAQAEPPGDAPSPEELTAFLGSVLDVTRADIAAANTAKAAGERREVLVAQGPVRLTDEGLAELQRHIRELHARVDDPQAGTQARFLVALVDLEDRPAPARGSGGNNDTEGRDD